MGDFSEKFYSKSRRKEEKESLDLLKKMTEDFKLRERDITIKRIRIEDKAKALEAIGFNISSIAIKEPDHPESPEDPENQSMYDMLSLIDRKLLEESEYLENLERAYDEVLANRN
jgi:hypothetical protein